jgi:hypothetical protein
MPVFWLAVVGALALLVRRTWKASKKRRQMNVSAEDQAPADSESPSLDDSAEAV